MDNSWIVEHENNDEHIFVTIVDQAVIHLSAVIFNLWGPLMVAYTLQTVGN